MSARPYRLLALVKQDAVVRVQKEPDDTVMTWPHLLSIEFLAAGMMSIFLLLMGLFINAPLEELANGNVTPAVAKAPWYFLGLQELLAYFHPTVAGVLTPLLVLVGAALIPYVDRGALTVDPSVGAEDRGRPVHAVLRPRPDPDVRRDLLPGAGLQLRHPVPAVLREQQQRAPLRPLNAAKGSTCAMSNYHVEPADKPQALSSEAIKSLRSHQVKGISRRQLLRYSIGGAMGVWGLELLAGTIGFIWPNLSGGFGGKVKIGTLERDQAPELRPARSPRASPPTSRRRGRSSFSSIRAARVRRRRGHERRRPALNVRSLYQRCPHLGCKPNPCIKNFWMECPCHGSRYDRLGIKAAGAQYGPAARSMDRFSESVDGDGVLTLDTGKITLGPLPVALGQPGIIPPRTPTGCI